jgi:hypothetical protein
MIAATAISLASLAMSREVTSRTHGPGDVRKGRTMRTRQKWRGIIVVVAVLLLASTGLGYAAGGGHGFGGHGFEGHGVRGFHGGFHHGFHRFGGPRVGIGIGLAPFGAPYWGAYPYDPYPSQPLSIEPAPAPSPWYYCDNAGGYYPYVQQCPGGWRAVTPTPS